ncbi:hypothetical protein LOTGIDRAFT_237694 [Lottia gigantea]|uniref:RRM domain-containing protein n=1 Tax=Lottia gigantea TaxID=225164 RepID=V4B074_LOTGI|nr:hypothetical protein LOTGIDRAFT_237694 [Lottia gigantea]ESP03383.1 hypothetical protein LOTGIDRAFT_237694 [Lottia gigantea]
MNCKQKEKKMISISGIEMIDFSIPTCNRKNLFMTNIVSGMDAIDVEDQLHCKFSQFGLLYEVQVFKSKNQAQKENAVLSYSENATAYYAFIKFYSSIAATRAQKNLTGKCFIGEKCCKITYAKRTKVPEEPLCLTVSQCVELANYYLGFNGWSNEIQLLKRYTSDVESNTEQDKQNVIENGTSVDREVETVKFVCITKLYITGHFLSSQGSGVWEEKYSRNGDGKGTAYGKARKIAKQRALQNALSKLLLIVLPDGKVTVEVNPLIPDNIPSAHDDRDLPFLKVNEIHTEVDLSDSDHIQDVLHNLQDLEESMIG